MYESWHSHHPPTARISSIKSSHPWRQRLELEQNRLLWKGEIFKTWKSCCFPASNRVFWRGSSSQTWNFHYLARAKVDGDEDFYGGILDWNLCYCWWLKSCTTRDVWNPVNNGINYQPQLVSRISAINRMYGSSRKKKTVKVATLHCGELVFSRFFVWAKSKIWMIFFRACCIWCTDLLYPKEVMITSDRW